MASELLHEPVNHAAVPVHTVPGEPQSTLHIDPLHGVE